MLQSGYTHSTPLSAQMPHLGRVSSHFFRLLRLLLLVNFASWSWSFYQSIQPHLDRISLEFLDIFEDYAEMQGPVLGRAYALLPRQRAATAAISWSYDRRL